MANRHYELRPIWVSQRLNFRLKAQLPTTGDEPLIYARDRVCRGCGKVFAPLQGYENHVCCSMDCFRAYKAAYAPQWQDAA